MQVGRQFVQQGNVSRLSLLRERFEVNHQAVIVIGGKEQSDLASKAGARCGIAQKIGDGGDKICAVKILDDRKDLHIRVFRLEERHDLVVHGMDALTVNYVEHGVRFGIHGFQMAICVEDLQPGWKQ